MSKEENKVTLLKIWKWMEYNRFVWIGPIIGLLLWAYALSCTPQTASPLDPGRFVNERQLAIDLKTWQADQEIMMLKFESAGADIEQQKENNVKIESMILSLASGGVPDMSSLLKLLIGGGGLGALADNVRKRGLIAGLKINKKS